jgi:hypothetical protein
MEINICHSNVNPEISTNNSKPTKLKVNDYSLLINRDIKKQKDVNLVSVFYGLFSVIQLY